jgi:hypothetical protein
MKLGAFYRSAIISNNDGISFMEKGDHEQAGKLFGSALSSLKASLEHQIKLEQHTKNEIGMKDAHVMEQYQATQPAIFRIQPNSEPSHVLINGCMPYFPRAASFSVNSSRSKGDITVSIIDTISSIRLESPGDIDRDWRSEVHKFDIETAIVLFNTAVNYISRAEIESSASKYLQESALKILFLAKDIVEEMIKSLPGESSCIQVLYGAHQLESLILAAVLTILTRNPSFIGDSEKDQLTRRLQCLQLFFRQYTDISDIAPAKKLTSRATSA